MLQALHSPVGLQHALTSLQTAGSVARGENSAVHRADNAKHLRATAVRGYFMGLQSALICLQSAGSAVHGYLMGLQSALSGLQSAGSAARGENSAVHRADNAKHLRATAVQRYLMGLQSALSSLQSAGSAVHGAATTLHGATYFHRLPSTRKKIFFFLLKKKCIRTCHS